MNAHLKLRLLLLLPFLAISALAGASSQYSATVTDENGRAVAGATVDFYDFPINTSRSFSVSQDEIATNQVTTDSKGAFTISAPPGNAVAIVKKSGRATVWHTWSPLDGPPAHPIVMTAPGTLSGTVVDENHRPVPDVEVWVSAAQFDVSDGGYLRQSSFSSKSARGYFSSRTDANGRFRIASFPLNAAAVLTVVKPGKAQIPYDFPQASNPNYRVTDHSITLMLGPGGDVLGRVTSEETGRPVAGVRVAMYSGDGSLFGTEMLDPVISGADGSFQIKDAAPGKYYLTGETSGQPLPDWVVVPENYEVKVVAGQSTHEVAFHLAQTVPVEATIVNTNDGKPVAGALVSSSVQTGDNGVALLRMAPGANWLQVAKKGWSPQNMKVVVEAGHPNKVRFEMIPPRVISGSVRDTAGVPVSGALVSFHPGQYPAAPHYVEVKTDEQGRYRLAMEEESEGVGWDGPADETNFVVARSPERNLAAVERFAQIPTNLDFVLQPGITLSGVVKDADGGAPVPGATVDLSMEGGRSIGRLFPEPIKVDAGGRFTIPGLPRGCAYYMFNAVTAPGYGSAFGQLSAENSKTNQYEFPPFVLKRGNFKVAGRVIGPDGNPLAGAWVNLNGPGQRNFGYVHSDSVGNFLFDAVCEGEVHLTATWTGPPRRGNVPTSLFSANGQDTVAHAGDSNVILQLRNPFVVNGAAPPLTVSGTVFDSSNQPAPGVNVQTWRTLQPGQNSVFTDSDGEFSIDWQPLPRSMDIKPDLVARDARRNLAATHEMDESITNLDLHLEPALTLTGTVTDADGNMVPDANVALSMVLNRASAPLEGARPDEHGAYSFSGLPKDASFSVTVTATGYARVLQARAEIVPGESNRLRVPPILLISTNRPWAGTVFDPSGAPVAHVELAVLPESPIARLRGQQSAPIVSDSAGKFSFYWQPDIISEVDWPLGLVLARDAEHNWVAFAQIIPTNHTLDLRLEPGMILSGSVRDTGNQPISRADVQLSLASEDSRISLARLVPTTVDDHGKFNLRALPANQSYEFLASAPGYGRATAEVFVNNTKTNLIEVAPITLKTANLRIFGQVVDVNGNPCEARVVAAGDDQPTHQYIPTDPNGHFVIAGICEGLLDVRATRAGRSTGAGQSAVGVVQAHGGDTNVIVKLGEQYGVPTAPPRGGRRGAPATRRLPATGN